MKNEFKQGQKVRVLGKTTGDSLKGKNIKIGDVGTVSYYNNGHEFYSAYSPNWKDCFAHFKPEDLEPAEDGIRTEDLKPGMIVEVNYVDDPRTIAAIDGDHVRFTTGACTTVSRIKRIASGAKEKNKYISVKDFTIERFTNERDREYGYCREYSDLMMIRLLRMTGNKTSHVISLDTLLPFMEEIGEFKNRLVKYGFIREERKEKEYEWERKEGRYVQSNGEDKQGKDKDDPMGDMKASGSDAATLLKRCIKHWEEILHGGEWKECALCGEYNNKWHSDYNCIECPIYRKTIAKYCINTPYSELFKHSMDSHDSRIVKIRCATCHRLVVEELELLNGLLLRGEEDRRL